MTVKSTALAASFLAAFAMLSAPAQAADTGGFFVNGRVGRSAVDKGALDDDDTGYAVNLGYRWAVAPNVSIGIEGGYADLGEFSAKAPLASTTTVSIDGWNVGATGHFNLDENWYLAGRLGLFRASSEVDNRYFRTDDTSNQWYAGVGFGYDFSNRFSVGLNYDYYKADLHSAKFNPDLISVSGEYRF